MYENEFKVRLACLREQKGVSARDMSLSLGQNSGYINNIESGKALPSMASFFYICEYLEISPKDFFDMDLKNPQEINDIVSDLNYIDDKQLESIATIIKALKKV